MSSSNTDDSDKNLLTHVNEFETIVDNIIYELLSTNVDVKTLDAYRIIVAVMEIVEKIKVPHPKLGSKRHFVRSAVNRLADDVEGVRGVESYPVSIDAKRSIKVLIKNKLLENFIDTVISATKGSYRINTEKRSCCIC